MPGIWISFTLIWELAFALPTVLSLCMLSVSLTVALKLVENYKYNSQNQLTLQSFLVSWLIDHMFPLSSRLTHTFLSWIWYSSLHIMNWIFVLPIFCIVTASLLATLIIWIGSGCRSSVQSTCLNIRNMTPKCNYQNY